MNCAMKTSVSKVCFTFYFSVIVFCSSPSPLSLFDTISRAPYHVLEPAGIVEAKRLPSLQISDESGPRPPSLGERGKNGIHEGGPLWGIMTQPVTDSEMLLLAREKFNTKKSSENPDNLRYSKINADYVKWLEASGARIIPVHYDASPQELKDTFYQINGLLYPGGNDIINQTQYYYASKFLFDLAMEENFSGYRDSASVFDLSLNDTNGHNEVNTKKNLRKQYESRPQKGNGYFPIHGTCLGFELISLFVDGSDYNSLFAQVDAENISLPYIYQPEDIHEQTTNTITPFDLVHSISKRSTLFEFLSYGQIEELAVRSITENFHHWGILKERFLASTKLMQLFDILGTQKDRNGVEFITHIEAREETLPLYAVQWHPERNAFEWTPTEDIRHDIPAITIMQSIANVLVRESKKNQHPPLDPNLLNKLLINSQGNLVYAGTQGSEAEYYFFERTKKLQTDITL